MGKQSRLESEALLARHEAMTKMDFQKGTNEYSSEHEDAKTHNDELHPWGKGTDGNGPVYVLPNANASKTQYKKGIDTTDGGGSYDKFGRNGIGGRQYLSTINIYNSTNAYGPNSVDTTENMSEGQYIVK